MSTSTDELLILTPEQKKSYGDNGYLHLRGFYAPDEMEEMQREYHEMVTNSDNRPENMSYSFMELPEGYAPDEFNPKNVTGMMDHVLVSDYWFDHFTDPRIVSVFIDLMGPNIDFHNGKVRNKLPGFTCTQSWHQDFPYERHSSPDLAAAITYLNDTDFEEGATEVIPGSHKKGEWETFNGVCISEDLVEEGSWEVCSAKAGDVIIVHVLVVHRAGHNYSGQSRNAIINEYKTMEAVDQWNNRCALAGLPLARNGKPLLPRIRQ